MAGTTFSATLDGVTNFNFHGTNYTWDSNGYLSNIDEYAGPGPDVNQFNLTLEGNFFVTTIHLGGSAFTNITDINDGGSRAIDYLHLSDLGGTVVLNDTYVTMLRQSGNNGVGGVANITLGDAGAGMIKLDNGNDTVRGGLGGIDGIDFGSGNNLLSAAAGISAQSTRMREMIRSGSGRPR